MRTYLVLFVVIIVGLIPVLADDVSAPIDPTEAIETALEDAPGLHELVTVEIVEADFGNGPREMLTVIYLTSEINELGYRLETLDLFRVVAHAVKADEIKVDMVVMVPSVTEDSAIEIASADLDDVLDLAEGNITRSGFIDQLTITPGAHQSAPTEEGDEV